PRLRPAALKWTRVLQLGAAIGLALAGQALIRMPKVGAAANPSVYAGYADNTHNGDARPSIWQGDPGVKFVGNSGATYDEGALRIDNPGPGTLVIDEVTLDAVGKNFDFWPRNISLAPQETLVLAGTQANLFDVSDDRPNDAYPIVHVTVSGRTLDFEDSTKVLLGGGADDHSTTEGHEWVKLGEIPPIPSISIGDASTPEGNSGVTSVTVPVKIEPAPDHVIQVRWATENGSAGGGTDYVPGAGTLLMGPVTASQTVSVSVAGDTSPEPTETLSIRLSTADQTVGLTKLAGVITIVDDDLVSAGISDVSVREGDDGSTPAIFTISLGAAAPSPIRVNFATADATATAAGRDYESFAGSLLIPTGDSAAEISVPVLGDQISEPNETFLLKVDSPDIQFPKVRGTATIIDDDGAADPELVGSDPNIALTRTQTIDSSNPNSPTGQGQQRGPTIDSGGSGNSSSQQGQGQQQSQAQQSQSQAQAQQGQIQQAQQIGAQQAPSASGAVQGQPGLWLERERQIQAQTERINRRRSGGLMAADLMSSGGPLPVAAQIACGLALMAAFVLAGARRFKIAGPRAVRLRAAQSTASRRTPLQKLMENKEVH
ncbi:MAG: Calx-beta domain-containing protein, partial [Actinomycetota bacterium]